MRTAHVFAVILGSVGWLAGPAIAQTAGDGTQGGVIQMQPLNALKPQAVAPGAGTGTAQPGLGQTQPVTPGQAPLGQDQGGQGLNSLGLGADQGVPAQGTAGQGTAGQGTAGQGTAGQGTAGQTDSSAPAPSVPGQTTTTTTTTQVAEAKGAVVRWLDKISGDVVDVTLMDGQSKTEGRLTITLADCRYPVNDPASDAFAYLTIHDKAVSAPIFKGWMIASSPALNPLDSARYDVWVLHCTTS